MASRRKKKKPAAECRVVQISKSGARKVVSRGSKSQCGAVKRELQKKNKSAAFVIEACS